MFLPYPMSLSAGRSMKDSMTHAAWLTWNRHNSEVGWENTGVKTVIYKVEIKCQFVSIENMCDQKRYFKVVEGSSQSLPLRIFSISCLESVDWFSYGLIYSKRFNKSYEPIIPYGFFSDKRYRIQLLQTSNLINNWYCIQKYSFY